MRRDQVLTLLKSKIDALLPTNTVGAIATTFAMSVAAGHRPCEAKAVVVSSRLGAQWRRLVKDLFDPYRPERHYMRGPGPKWREKHGIVAAG